MQANLSLTKLHSFKFNLHATMPTDNIRFCLRVCIIFAVHGNCSYCWVLFVGHFAISLKCPKLRLCGEGWFDKWTFQLPRSYKRVHGNPCFRLVISSRKQRRPLINPLTSLIESIVAACVLYMYVFETTSKWGDIPLNVLTPITHPPKSVCIQSIYRKREKERERERSISKSCSNHLLSCPSLN